MIEHLRLRSFQCHRKFDLELDPHVTVLVGSSDRGKSAVLRALRWLCTNRPAGDAFIAHGREAVGVTLSVDGRAVKRSKGRGGKSNLFQLDDGEYAAFGQDVPAPIAELLNLDLLLNFQRQHDAPFWFSLSPGEVAKELNRVVNLELIDRTLANAAAEARRVKAVIGVSEERLEKAKAEAERLAWVTEADAALRDVENKETELSEKRDKIAQVASALEQVRRLDRKIDRLTGAKDDGNAALSAAQAAMDATTRVERLRDAVQKCNETERQLCRTKENQAEREQELAEVKVCPACGKPR